jgi:uncharacterized protein YecE (DUF72 family)
VFAANVPQVITREKVLVDCEAEFKQFIEAMNILGENVGPLLFQFGYFHKNAFVGANDSLARRLAHNSWANLNALLASWKEAPLILKTSTGNMTFDVRHDLRIVNSLACIKWGTEPRQDN